MNTETNNPTYPRVRIRGRLVCKSALHIGDGSAPQRWTERWPTPQDQPPDRHPMDLADCKNDSIADAANTRECTYHGVCFGYDHETDSERPYIPGSTLRGGLRRLLEQSTPTAPAATPENALVSCLFGFVQTPQQGGCKAGQLRIYDAPLNPTRQDFSDQCPPPFWSARRRTAARHGIQINDRLGTVQGRLLYSHELIPAGSVFDVELEADRITDRTLQELLGLLERWNGGLAAAIGGKAGKGWGRVQWESIKVEVISEADLQTWLDSDATDLPFNERIDVQAIAPKADPRPLEIPIRLIAESPILVNEPGYRALKPSLEAIENGVAIPPTHAYSRDPDGTAILPGKSLVGMLRARARRIVATIAHQHFDETPDTALHIADSLVERLFGGRGRRGALWLGDAECDGTNRRHAQHFIAIDRFTGGVKGRRGAGALFHVEACADGAYSGRLLLETDRLRHQEARTEYPDWWKGLLWLLARDAADGELRIGWGKAKGYGAFRLDPQIGFADASLPGPGEKGRPQVDQWLHALHGRIEHQDVRRVARPQVDDVEPDAAAAIAAPEAQEGDPAAPPRPVCPEPAAPPASQPPLAVGFYLPYQFIPATGCVGDRPVSTIPWGVIEADCNAGGAPSPIRHDIWLKGTHSGRLHCRLTLETDTFVGAEHDVLSGDPAHLVKPYERFADRAIPGNSLRGMIASVAESISQSALRVLEDRYYSVRKHNNDRLQQLGTLKQEGDAWFVTAQNHDIPIAEDVMERFSRLWVDRMIKGETTSKVPPQTRAHLPRPSDYAHPDRWRPQPGSRVAYKIDGQPPCVTEISFSRTWRQEIKRTTHQFFAEISPDLIPWGTQDRDSLTPAEALFGVVEDEKQKDESRCLASRVRVHDALPRFADENAKVACETEPRLLRILSDPKPPSPALYFHKQGARGSHIKKQDLGTVPGHRPNGRKFYLHHPVEQTANRWWFSMDHDVASNTRNQKVQIQRMLANQSAEFWFPVEFDNLSDAELTLLRTAVAPSDGFLHHLGLGKPHGLGSVRVSAQAVELIALDRRYGTDASTDGRAWYCANPEEPPIAPSFGKGRVPPSMASWRGMSELPCDPVLIDPPSLEQLLALGKRVADAWVHHPLNRNQPVMHDGVLTTDCEKKTYEWFVANEKSTQAQALGPIDRGRPLPKLRKYANKNGD